MPGVVKWFRVYCGALTLVYLGLAVFGIVFLVFGDRLVQGDDVPRWLRVFYAGLFGGLGLVFGAGFAAGLFLPPRPWAWIYGLVLIAIGFTSACCLPFCVVLLIFWLKPETRVYFARAPI